MVTHTITIRLGTRFDSNEIHKILLKICREFNWNLKKNFSEADQIRAELLEAGVILEDKPGGATEWRRV